MTGSDIPKIVNVILDYEISPDGSERVVLVGVYDDEKELVCPAPKPGAQRNTVQAFLGATMKLGVFRVKGPSGG